MLRVQLLVQHGEVQVRHSDDRWPALYRIDAGKPGYAEVVGLRHQRESCGQVEVVVVDLAGNPAAYRIDWADGGPAWHSVWLPPSRAMRRDYPDGPLPPRTVEAARDRWWAEPDRAITIGTRACTDATIPAAVLESGTTIPAPARAPPGRARPLPALVISAAAGPATADAAGPS